MKKTGLGRRISSELVKKWGIALFLGYACSRLILAPQHRPTRRVVRDYLSHVRNLPLCQSQPNDSGSRSVAQPSVDEDLTRYDQPFPGDVDLPLIGLMKSASNATLSWGDWFSDRVFTGSGSGRLAAARRY